MKVSHIWSRGIDMFRKKMTCMRPYAVPNWYSGIIRAAIGQSAEARRLYATPKQEMDINGFTLRKPKLFN